MLVADASVLVATSSSAEGWAVFRGEQLVAPRLSLSEALSVLHEARWRGELSAEAARRAADNILGAPLTIENVDLLEAWAVADGLGRAKTYDAEYVAHARKLRCRLVTVDARPQRGAARLVDIVSPDEI